ncbi:MAG TPA: hypothetical protein VLK65_29055 [Vicinamibacteria bacterium]|nr:hypothetical protein [Vicinamibacteria bacterium]
MVLLLVLLLVQHVDGLAPGEGREVVEAVCTACHSAEIITASHMSRKSWDTTIDWMQEYQGLAELEPDVRETILDYLATTQGLEGETADSESPWAYPLYRPNPIW